jgi:hypothetical protein
VTPTSRFTASFGDLIDAPGLEENPIRNVAKKMDRKVSPEFFMTATVHVEHLKSPGTKIYHFL